ncbi:MAG: sugar phosphate nucleotidyltransferase [Candidatus Omnitrophota bacterium]
MQDLDAIVLAAGKSTRLKSGIPKVLQPIFGKPMLGYILDLLSATRKLKRIILVIGYKKDLVKVFIKNYQKKKDIRLCLQRRLLGTADAIKATAGLFKKDASDVLIFYGDHPLIRKETLFSLIEVHSNTRAACTLLTALVGDPAGYGRIIRDKNNDVKKIVEEKDASPEQKRINEINTGVYCFKKDVLFSNLGHIKLNEQKKEYYLTDIIECLDSQGYHIQALRIEDDTQAQGVNTREDLNKASDIIRRRILVGFIEKGVNILDPNNTYIYPNVKIGGNSVIYPYTFIEHDVVIGRRCSVGPFSHLRPGTVLEDDASIGNFTELNRTRVGRFTKVRHFSYLGDAKVGDSVNIGAGTVTANYDGRKKNVTKIGKGAFIGSDTVLVAPVKVGKKAVTGAGSVVTAGCNVKDYSVVVGVPARVLKKKISRLTSKRLKSKR